jgi:MFS family permease
LGIQSLRDTLKGNLLIFTLGDLLRNLSMFITFPYFSLFITELGGDMVQIGIVNSLRPLLSLFLYPIAGYMSDNYSRIKVISYTVFIGALLWGSLGLAPDWRWIALVNLLLGVLTFYFPAANSLIADSLPVDKRGLGYSMWLAIPKAAGIFSPLIGGYIITLWGVEAAMRYLYVLTFLVTVFIAFMNHRYLKDPVEDRPKRTPKNLLKILVDSYRDIYYILKWLPTNLKAFGLMLALGFMFNNMVTAYWVVYAVNVIGLSELNWGIVLFVSNIVNVLLLIPGGMVVDRFGVTRVLKISLLLVAVPTLLYPFCQGFLCVTAIITVISIANSFLMGGAPAYMAQAVPQEKRGMVMSALGQGMLFVNTLGGAGGPGMGALLTVPSIIGALLGGFIYNYNPTLLWIFLGSTMIVNAVICHLYLEKTD